MEGIGWDQEMLISQSTVGRILSKLMTLGRIKPGTFYRDQVKPKRCREFKHHAMRWKRDMEAEQPLPLVGLLCYQTQKKQ